MPKTLSSSMAGHHEPRKGRSDDWITDPRLIEALGPFDLDPCASKTQPWPTAAAMLVSDDGLSVPWAPGLRILMNPPYGEQVGLWLERLATHGVGTAVVFARTETEWFHRWVWGRATAILFPKGRLTFYRPDGSCPGKGASGCGSVLAAYGNYDALRLHMSEIPGHFIQLRDLKHEPRRQDPAEPDQAGS